MKKTLLLTALCVASIAAFTGCGTKAEEAAPATQEAATEAVVEETSEAAVEDVTVEEITDVEETTVADTEADPAEVAAFADEIKAAVAAKDMEALAGLMAYPGYVGIGDGIEFASKDEFLAISADDLFTQELLDSVAAADTSALEVTGAGYIIGDSMPDVIFGYQADGTLAITGINY